MGRYNPWHSPYNPNKQSRTGSYACIYYRADSRLAPSQRETSLQSNAVSHWLGANLLESGNILHTCVPRTYSTTKLCAHNPNFVKICVAVPWNCKMIIGIGHTFAELSSCDMSIFVAGFDNQIIIESGRLFVRFYLRALKSFVKRVLGNSKQRGVSPTYLTDVGHVTKVPSTIFFLITWIARKSHCFIM